MSFNTITGDFTCPFCKEKVLSGVGFRLGTVSQITYEIGEELRWNGEPCRPARKPEEGIIKTIGYFNCDNVACSSWQDCYPDVQTALVTVENNRIASVEPYKGSGEEKEFAILEPASLSQA